MKDGKPSLKPPFPSGSSSRGIVSLSETPGIYYFPLDVITFVSISCSGNSRLIFLSKAVIAFSQTSRSNSENART